MKLVLTCNEERQLYMKHIDSLRKKKEQEGTQSDESTRLYDADDVIFCVRVGWLLVYFGMMSCALAEIVYMMHCRRYILTVHFKLYLFIK